MAKIPFIKMLFCIVVFGIFQMPGISMADEAKERSEKPQLSASETAWLAAHPVIRLGDDFSWPPFVFMDDKGVYSGISSGYIASISKNLGIQIHPVLGLTWAQVLDKVKSGEVDILPAVVRSKEREAFLNFSKPYISFPIVIATHREGPTADNLTDLAGRKTGVVKGYITNELLAKDYPAINLATFDSLTAGLEALEARKIDALVDNLGAITYEARRLRLANIKIASTTKYKFELSIGVRKDWPELVPILDKTLDSMSGLEKSSIENAWLAIEVNFGVDYRTIVLWAVPLGVSALIIIIVIAAWNRRLHVEIQMRERVTKQLKESEEHFRLLFNAGNDGISLHDMDEETGRPVGRFIEVNDVACHRLGYSREELLQMGPMDIDDASVPLGSDIPQNLKEKGWVVFNRVQITKDGRHIPVEINARKISYQGKPLVLAIARDVSLRQTLEDELRRSNAELEQFAYVASHDLRSPLRAVISYLSLIERSLGTSLTPELAEFIGFASGGAKRMESLIVGLLDYSRVGRKEDDFQTVSLGDAISECQMNLVDPIKTSQGTVSVADGFPMVTGNRMELVRLFQNLIGNALKYHAPDRSPQVKVDWKSAEKYWLISVSDNGIGISAEDFMRCFNIFQRLQSQEKYEGTGIGLALCKKITEHHGGKIWVESTLGAGSTFFLTLPKQP